MPLAIAAQAYRSIIARRVSSVADSWPAGASAVAIDKGTYSMANRYVVFSHGKDSGPGAARSRRWPTSRAPRATTSNRSITGASTRSAGASTRCSRSASRLSGDLVLVGSSLGGYVSVAAASPLHARGRVPDGTGAVHGGPAAAARTRARLSRDASCTAGATRWCRSTTAYASRASTTRRCTWSRATTSCMSSSCAIKYLFEYFLIGLDLPLATA